MFSIRELSGRSGVSTQTVRYYERINLLPPAKRAENGYRLYDEVDVERLQFIRRARALDFALSEVAEILALRDHIKPLVVMYLELCGSVFHRSSGALKKCSASKLRFRPYMKWGNNYRKMFKCAPVSVISFKPAVIYNFCDPMSI